MTDESPDVLVRLRSALATIEAPDELLLQTALNEAWFSNILAWLLNPKGSHGLGVRFCNAFVACVARSRTDSQGDYARRATFLKWDKQGAGVGATGFGFRNAAVLREYYLSKPVKRQSEHSGGFCDVVFLDLDTDDSFFLAIENKLFTSDHSDQLENYHAAIDEKYGRAAVRELVYLTVSGEAPVGGGPHSNHWVRLSWTRDILDILAKLSIEDEPSISRDVNVLVDLLTWLKQVTELGRITDLLAFKKRLLKAAAECLLEELERLDKPGGGHWTRFEPTSGTTERICYTTLTASHLSIELLPGLAVTVQGRTVSGRAQFDKIVVPFGAHPDQVMNLIDIAARDLYYKFFEPSEEGPPRYLSGKRRLRTSTTEMEIRHRQVFKFVHEHRFALKPMLLQSDSVRKAVGIRDEGVAEAQ